MQHPHGRFGLRHREQSFVIDTVTLTLLKNGVLLAVEPKPLQLLALLVRKPGELLNKNEIMDSVWAGRAVSESVIARSINKLRHALGDQDQTLILSVHAYGYRLTAPVIALHSDAKLPPPVWVIHPGDRLPERPHWRLRRPLGNQGRVWLAEHEKTGDARVFKFAPDHQAADVLRRELMLYRVLHKALGDRPDFVRLYDYQFDAVPCFLELEYCAQGSLADWLPTQGKAKSPSLALRLELLAQAAESLAAAHAVGVVHQDVKPENLLVATAADGRPQLVWADFGSGWVDAATLEKWRVTQLPGCEPGGSGNTAGTALYLAPERLAGLPASVKSDLYSLGVMLYQLVVGDLRRPLAPGWERAVDDPLLRADIAACADTDPLQRLGDAAELARRLRSLPLRQAAERQQQEAAQREQALQAQLQHNRHRRRRLQLALAASLIALAGLGVHERLLTRQHQQTERALATAESLNQFLADDILAAANPYLAGGGSEVTMAATLERAAAGIHPRFPTQPAVRASLFNTVGDAYRALNLYPQAIAAHEQGIQAAREAEGPLSVAAGEMSVDVSMSLIELGQSAEARDRLQGLIAIFAKHASRQQQVIYASARHTLGWALLELGLPRQSELELRAALQALGTPGNPRENSVWLDTRWDLAETLLDLGALHEAAEHIEAAYQGFRADAALGEAYFGWVDVTRAKLYTEMGQWQKADDAIVEMESIAAGLPPLHRIGLLARYARARWWLAQNRFAEADAVLRPLLPDMTATVGAGHDWTISTQQLQVQAQLDSGHAESALALARQLIAETQGLGPDSPHSIRAPMLLAKAEIAAASLRPQTLPELRAALAQARQREAPGDALMVELLLTEAALLRQQGDAAAAASMREARQLGTALQARGRRPWPMEQ